MESFPYSKNETYTRFPSCAHLLNKQQLIGVYDCDNNWRASETLSGVYKFELVRYMCVYIYICMEVPLA